MILNLRICIAATLLWVLSITAIALILRLIVHYGDGFSSKPIWILWKYKDARMFNYHSLCMIIGFTLVSPTGALVYRLSPGRINKSWQKIIHFLILLTALAFASVGLTAVIKYHDKFGYKNFIDVHSWCGLATIGLFVLQFVAGFISFLFPKLPNNARSKVARWHVVSGKTIILLAVVTAITGVARRYGNSELSKEQQVANSLAMVLFILFGVLFYALTMSRDRSHSDNEPLI